MQLSETEVAADFDITQQVLMLKDLWGTFMIGVY